jgi:hypothetical protein
VKRRSDAGGVVVNPACQLLKIFGAQPTRILPMKRTLGRAPVPQADSSSFQGIFVL